MTIGGTIITHDCIRQEYCLEEAIGSLLDVCDEVVCVDAESSDGTLEMLRQLEAQQPKLRIYQSIWRPNPDKPGKWLADLSNEARMKLSSEFQIAVQADEVLHEDDYELIWKCAQSGQPYLVRRLNFWRDAYHLAPHGKVCGHNIVRMGPSSIPFIGDAENLDFVGRRIIQSEVRLFHYGFLRGLEAQIAKGISMEESFFRKHNPCYDEMIVTGSRKPFDDYIKESDQLQYSGTHPAIIHEWLSHRDHLDTLVATS